MNEKLSDSKPKYIRGKYTPAQGKACEKYCKANYDEIKVRVKKGQKAVYIEAAESVGMSLNGFINMAMSRFAEQIRAREEEYEEEYDR